MPWGQGAAVDGGMGDAVGQGTRGTGRGQSEKRTAELSVVPRTISDVHGHRESQPRLAEVAQVACDPSRKEQESSFLAQTQGGEGSRDTAAKSSCTVWGAGGEPQLLSTLRTSPCRRSGLR